MKFISKNQCNRTEVSKTKTQKKTEDCKNEKLDFHLIDIDKAFIN